MLFEDWLSHCECGKVLDKNEYTIFLVVNIEVAEYGSMILLRVNGLNACVK